jgi:hypothetical protein
MCQSHLVCPVTVTMVFGCPWSRTDEAIKTMAEKPQETRAIPHVPCLMFAKERRMEAYAKPRVRFEISVSRNR